jgi:hypothetical protein
MTIRQISEAAGCHIDTVRKIARPMFPMVVSEGRGLAIDYDKEQSIDIMERLPKRNMVDPLNNQVVPVEKSRGDERFNNYVSMLSSVGTVSAKVQQEAFRMGVRELNRAFPVEDKKPVKKQLTAIEKEVGQRLLIDWIEDHEEG